MLCALLFDLDGTLTHTDPTHMRAWREELAEHGLEIDEAFYREHISGRLNPDIVSDLLPELDRGASERLIDRKEARFRSQAEGLEPLPGLASVLAWARDRNLDLALVTNAPRQNALFMLDALDLSDAFPTVVLGHDAPAGKPDPAPYRMALEQLGVDPDAGIAFEDSASGVRSATGAGLAVVGVTTTHSDAELRAAGAMFTVTDFSSEALWSYLKSRATDGDRRAAR